MPERPATLPALLGLLPFLQHDTTERNAGLLRVLLVESLITWIGPDHLKRTDGQALRQYFVDRDGNPVLTRDGRPVHAGFDEQGQGVLAEDGRPRVVPVEIPEGSRLESLPAVLDRHSSLITRHERNIGESMAVDPLR